MKKILVCALLLVMAVCLSGCFGSGVTNPVAPERTPFPPMEVPFFEDAEAARSVYNEVSLDDTKSVVEEKLGPGEENKTSEGSKYYLYMKGDYGVTIAYDSMDKVLGKVLVYDDVRQLSHLTAKPLEGAAYAIANGTKYEDAVSILGGDAIEIAAARHTQDNGGEVRTTLVLWVDEDGTTLQATLGSDGKFSDVIFQGVEKPSEDK